MRSTGDEAVVHRVGYTLHEQLHVSHRSTLFRATRLSDASPVILKLTGSDYLDRRRTLELRHEHALARRVEGEGIVRVLGLEEFADRAALVMEDFGGCSLRHLLDTRGPLDVPTFLDVAVRLGRALGHVHRHGVIHKDIKPHNVIIHPVTGVLKLTDFSRAVSVLLETVVPELPTQLAGTLAYMAPEQTGRMNRGLDYRADFYALGATFFELLTGRHVFVSEDPLELIHAHVSRKPPSPRELVPALPEALAALVLKLLAKAPEARYQSARSLLADLEECQRQWRERGDISPFALDHADLPAGPPPALPSREAGSQDAPSLSQLTAHLVELMKVNQTLEQRVQACTEELHHKSAEHRVALERLQALQAQIITQEKLASLGSVTAGIAHELKNPLNFVKNFSELSLERVRELREALATHQEPGELLEELEQSIGKVCEHEQRASGIINGMLKHARTHRGERQPIAINPLVEEAVRLVHHGQRAQRLAQRVVIDMAFDDTVPQLHLVAEDLRRVVLNLLDNGCYAAQEKARRDASEPPRLKVSTRWEGGGLELRVRDNGNGIPAAVRHRLFTPFFTTKPAGEGTGLGLSLSHDIVVALGGTLKVESEEGRYTEFTIVLPAELARRA